MMYMAVHLSFWHGVTPKDPNRWRLLYSQEQACLDVRPRILQLNVRVHPEQNPQAAGETTGLLLQQVGLRFPLKA